MKPEYLSGSRIQQYLMCPQKYKLQYVDKVTWDFTPGNLALGSAIHAAIESFYRTWQDGSRMPENELCNLFEGFWQGQIKGKTLDPKNNPDKLKEQGISLLEVFSKDVQPATVLAIEEQFRVPLVDTETGEYMIDLVGVIDLVEADTNHQPVIVDHKSIARRPSDSDLHQNLQLSAYGYAIRMLRELQDRKVLMRIDCLIKNKNPVFEQRYTLRTPSTDRKFELLARNVIHAIENEAFFPNPGWGCNGCQVRNHCSMK